VYIVNPNIEYGKFMQLSANVGLCKHYIITLH